MDWQPRVEQALQVVYEPRSSVENRRQAQDLCDAFSDRAEAAREGLALYAGACREGKDDKLRLFALSATEKAVKKFWQALSDGDKDQVKKDALCLVDAGTRPAEVEQRFIKSKVVGIVVEIAKREWPQQWPAFLRLLEEIALHGMTQASLVMAIVRDLAEDCTNSEFNSSLSPRRRTEILTEIRGSLDTLISMCYKFLESCFLCVRSEPSGNSATVKQAVALAKSTLGALEAMSDISPVQMLIEKNIIPALAEFTKPIPSLGIESRLPLYAWRCICSYTVKQAPERSTIDGIQWITSLLVPFTQEGTMPVLRPLCGPPGSVEAVWPTFAFGNDSGSLNRAQSMIEFQEIHKLMAQSLASIATTFMKTLVETTNENERLKVDDSRPLEALRIILNGTFRFLCHPSLQVRLQILPGVSAYVRVLPEQKRKVRPAGFVALLDAQELFLRCMADHLIKVGHPSSPHSANWPNANFSLEEYEDEFEFDNAFTSAITIGKAIIKQYADSQSLNAINFLRRRIEIACSRSTSTPVATDGVAYSMDPRITFFTGNENLEGSIEFFDPRTAYFRSTLIVLVDAVSGNLQDSIYSAFGSLSTNLPTSESANVEAAGEIRKILQILLQFDARASFEWYGCMHALSRFSPSYGAPPDGPNIWLSPTLERLFKCAKYRSDDEIARGVKGSLLSPATLAARKRGCMALVEICTQLSAKHSSTEIRSRLAALLPNFCTEVLAALDDQSNPSLPYEKLLLYEVLVLVSNTLEDANAQTKFVQDIVAQPLSEWVSPRIAEACSDSERFVTALRNAPSNADRVLIDAKRSLSLVLSIGRKCKSINGRPRPFAQYWSTILPNVFSMIKVIHSVAKNRAAFMDVLFIHPEELRCLVGQPSKKIRGSAQQGVGQTPVNASPAATQSSTLWMDPNNANSLDDMQSSGGGFTSQDDATWYLLHLHSSLREGLYSALSSAVRYRESGIFGIPQALETAQSVLFSDLESMEHRHLARVIQSVLMSIIVCCPERLMEPFLFPLLSHVLGHTFKRLESSWGWLPTILKDDASRNSQRLVMPQWEPILWKPLEDQEPKEEWPNTVDSDNSNCQTRQCGRCMRCQQSEMARDASIRLLGSAFVDLVGGMLYTNPVESAKDPHDQVPSEICSKVLRSDQLAAAALLSLTGVLSSPDSNAISKVSSIFRRMLFNCLLNEPRFHNFTVNQLFTACFATLYSPKTTLVENTSQVLLQVLTFIWSFALHGSSDFPRETGAIQPKSGANQFRDSIRQILLRGIPYVKEEMILQAENAICNATTDKTRRVRVKEFIQTCVYERSTRENVAVESVVFLSARDQQTVPDLPPVASTSRSSRNTQSQEWVNAANSWDLGVQLLFEGGGLN